MDFEKLQRWYEAAQKLQGKNFWSSIFDQDDAHPFMHDVDEDEQANVHTMYPKVDILSGPQEYIILIDIPGVRKEDVQLSLSGEYLFVKGTARSVYPDMQRLTSERFSGTFERTIKLPEPVGKAKVSAKFDCGMLYVQIAPQAKAQVQIHID